MVVFATNDSVAPRATGISDTGTYILRNKATGLALTIPQYTDDNKNIYQTSNNSQTPYAFAVKLTYSQTTGFYTISSILYENLISGRVTFGQTTSNVYLTQEDNIGTEQWHIAYNDLCGGYIIRTADGSKVLTAIGSLPGNSSDTSLNSNGNIALTNYIGASSQVWEIASVSPNAHIVKPYSPSSTSGIEKKNIAKNSEWLFQIRNSEMTNRTIISVEAVTAQSLVQIAYTNHYFVVKINENDATAQDTTDNFALIKITLDGNEIRYIMVQDSGTGNGDACWTMPVYQYPRVQTVTSNGYRDYMITLSSELNGVKIKEWTIDDSNIIDIASYNGLPLKGNNYAVIKAKTAGYTFINAIAEDGNSDPSDDIVYRKLIEVELSGTINQNSYTIPTYNLTLPTPQLQLAYDNKYLIKTSGLLSSSVTDLNGIPIKEPSEIWRITDSNYLTLLDCGMNFIIIKTAEKSVFESLDIVTQDEFFVKEISAQLTTGLFELNLLFKKNDKLIIENGNYYIQNSHFNTRFIEANKVDTEYILELDQFNGGNSQNFYFSYVGDGYYKIATSDNSGLAFAISDDNTKVIRESYTNTDKFKWRLRYTEGAGYTIQNKKTLSNPSTYNYALTAYLNGTTVDTIIHQPMQSGNADSWNIWKVELGGSYYQNKDTEYLNEFRIGYWENSPTVSLEIFSSDLTEDEIDKENVYQNALQNAVDAWSVCLGIDIIIDNTANADITFLVSDHSEYNKRFGIQPDVQDLGLTDVDIISESEYWKKCNGTSVFVNEINKANVWIFVHTNVQYIGYVFLHELGHALGYLSHSPSNATVMRENTNSGVVTTLQSADYDSLKLLYDEHCMGG